MKGCEIRYRYIICDFKYDNGLPASNVLERIHDGYCCSVFEEWTRWDNLYESDGEVFIDKHIIVDDDGGPPVDTSIKFCPFCGAEVERVEVERIVRKRREIQKTAYETYDEKVRK